MAGFTFINAKTARFGNGMDDGILLGPLVSKGQHGKVLAASRRGRDEGTRTLTGGGVPDAIEKGFFIEPTIFVDMSAES